MNKTKLKILLFEFKQLRMVITLNILHDFINL